MNYKIILDSLNSWDKNELLCKEFYELQQEGRSTDDFFSRHSKAGDFLYLDDVMHPEDIASFFPEDCYMKKMRNVVLIKHPRYSPFYYHRHAFFEMIYVLSGQCRHRLKDSSTVLKKGDIVVLAPDVTHGIELHDSSIILNILIRKSTFLDIFMNTIRDKSQIGLFFLDNIYAKAKIPYILFHTKGDPVIRNYILDMYLEQIQLDEYSDHIMCNILSICFTQLNRLHKKSLEIPLPKRTSSYDEEQILNYIVNHYNTITLKELSQHFHFSEPYCTKIIKSITGQSFTELVYGIRLRQAENYLMLTPMSIADISEKLGYKNPETFIRMFKRSHGISPALYRKSNYLKG